MAASQNAVNGPVPLPKNKPDAVAVVGLAVKDAPRPSDRPAGLELPPHPLSTGLLSRNDLGIYKQAFAAAEKRDWTLARFIASEAKYKLPAKIIDWRYFITYGSDAAFDEITAFIRDNPGWPYQTTLRRRAEQSLNVSIPPQKTINWFTAHNPQTGTGMYRYGEALLASNREAEGRDWIRRAWRSGDLPELLEKEMRREATALLTRADHEERLDHLLWEGNSSAAMRMLDLVSTDMKALARARLALMTGKGDVDQAIRAVPARLQNDPGLILERTKWRRAREWLSGWIALRFLNDGKTALRHFGNLYENVSYPISRARGAYWIGRAQSALGDRPLAEYWYKIAGQYYTTYYGQMALHALGQKKLPEIPKISKAQTPDARVPGTGELYLAIRQLAELGEPRLTRPFLMHLADLATQEEEYVTLADLANGVGRPDYAISIAKQAAQSGTELVEVNWPTPKFTLKTPPVEPALMLAITRQESAFAEDAVSRAGARGLMQLMPGTAQDVSRKLNIGYSADLLTADPAYNALLGSSYLADLINSYNGSYVLAIAAYNAGPSNVNRWIGEYGDPRTGDIDSIDWIEFMPYGETRNYVQRVIENLQIYRERLKQREDSILQIAEDINRGSPAD